REETVGMDGPVFHAAREAVEASRAAHGDRPVFAGFGAAPDRVLTGIAAGISTIRGRWTDRQREGALLLREGRTQAEVAGGLGSAALWAHPLVGAAALAARDELGDGFRAALGLDGGPR